MQNSCKEALYLKSTQLFEFVVVLLDFFEFVLMMWSFVFLNLFPRMTYDEIFQKLEKEIDDFQKASTIALKSNQKKISEAKAEHEKQMQAGASLQAHIEAAKAEIAELKQELTAATDDLTQLTQTRSDQVSSLKVGDLKLMFSSSWLFDRSYHRVEF